MSRQHEEAGILHPGVALAKFTYRRHPVPPSLHDVVMNFCTVPTGVFRAGEEARLGALAAALEAGEAQQSRGPRIARPCLDQISSTSSLLTAISHAQGAHRDEADIGPAERLAHL